MSMQLTLATLTRADLERWARDIYEEARKVDPHHVDELTERLLGRAVWCWSSMTCRELRALSSAMMPTAMAGRG